MRSSLFVFMRTLCVKTATYEKGYFFSGYETNVVTLPVVTENNGMMNFYGIRRIQKANVVIAIVTMVLLPVFALAQSEVIADNERYAIAKFDKLSHDFGEIEKGAEAVAIFTITNQGQAPLVIENVKVSCGCTVVKWSSEPVMPQDVTQIKVSYNSNIVGEIKRSVVVKTNDRKQKRTLLLITGEVKDDEIEE